MSMNRLVKLSMSCCMLLAVTACQTTGISAAKNNDGRQSQLAQVTDANATQTQGIAEAENFDGVDRGTSSTLTAPHNQVFHFAFDNSHISKQDKQTIMAQARYLRSHPNARILLTGHTDERGSREYNVALGERRAVSVEQLLRLSGVKPNQMRKVSYGQEQPVAYGHEEASYRKNRRVELIYEETA